MASSSNSIKILEICRVTPATDSPAANELSLPLTFFDIYWLKFPPVKRIFFYQLTDSTPDFFSSVILPQLKQSLSLTLLHFLPVAGNLTWPLDEAKPIILCTLNDGVSLTVAESSADLDPFCSNNERFLAIDLHPLVPELLTSKTQAPVFSLQITLFPNKGFSIGYAANHATTDGKSIIMFMKAWAYTCKNREKDRQPSFLPPELTPCFDRSVVQDPDGIDMDYLNFWLGIKWPGLDTSPRSLNVFPTTGVASDSVRATFGFSREDINRIRERVLAQWNTKDFQEDRMIPDEIKLPHLSSFVLTYAYTVVCLVKAKGSIASNSEVQFGFAGDCRARLAPIPPNYFGNCVGSYQVVTEAEALMADHGVVFAVKKLSEVIKGLEKEPLEGAKEKLAKLMGPGPGSGAIWVAGSTQLRVYGVDFGWGRPKKVEVTTIDRTGAVSMAESRDGSGGVEIGIVLKKHEMDIFRSLFVNGLKLS